MAAAATTSSAAADKREFIAACEDFADGHLLRTFSLVGTRGDADLMLLARRRTWSGSTSSMSCSPRAG